MFDPPVHRFKTVFMQRLLDAVIHGYFLHTSGIVPLHKAAHLADKFAERFDVDRNENQRAYARKNGLVNARLFFLTQSGETDLSWLLLVTDGAGAVHEQERLQHATDSRARIRIADDYELVRHTRSRNKGGGDSWTWRMTGGCYERWRVRIIAACRQSDAWEIRRAMRSLFRVPGFAGVRKQAGQLVALTRAEWRRRHGDLEGLILPETLPYVERLPDTTICISASLCSPK